MEHFPQSDTHQPTWCYSAGTLPVITNMYDVSKDPGVKILVRESNTMQVFACYKKKMSLTFIHLKKTTIYNKSMF